MTETVEAPAFPMTRDCPFDPPPALTTILREQPITRVRLFDGSTPWIVTRYKDARQVLRDPRFSADSSRPGYPQQSPGNAARRKQVRTFLNMDNPEHNQHRRLLTRYFAVKRIENMRPRITQIVNELIDQMLAELRQTDDPALITNAVEELLRYLTIIHFGRRRVALADVEVGGQLIRAGEGVVVAVNMANRDPEAFPDPDRLDIHRSARHHVAFGYGIHQCLGQPLARVELQVAYGTLFRRIPTLALAQPFEDVDFKHDMLIYGVHSLPVTW